MTSELRMSPASGECRGDRVGERVAEVDAPAREALRASGAHVVRVEHAEHLDPHDAGEDRSDSERERDDRKDVRLRSFASGDRQQLQLDAEDVDERDTEEEVGDRRDEHASAREAEFEAASATAMRARRRSPTPTGTRDDDGGEEGEEGERCGGRKALRDDVDHRHPRHDRRAEVAREQPLQVVQVLLPERQVQAEVLTPLGDERRGSRRARALRGPGPRASGGSSGTPR